MAITLLIFLLIVMLLYAIGYIVYRFMAPVRHDLANKEIDSKVLKLLWEELDKLGLGYLVIEARNKIK
jgi:hypothetical protein